MDSLSVAWWLRPRYGVTVDYGQLPATAEIAASAEICRCLSIEHITVKVDCRQLGSGDMAGAEPSRHAPESDWWPYRNQMLVTFAAMRTIGLGVTRLLLGTVKSDEVHRDGSPAFVEAMSSLLSMQEGGMTVGAPAIHLSTLELIRSAEVPPEILAFAHSCHKTEVACGNCVSDRGRPSCRNPAFLARQGRDRYGDCRRLISGSTSSMTDPSAMTWARPASRRCSS